MRSLILLPALLLAGCSDGGSTTFFEKGMGIKVPPSVVMIDSESHSGLSDPCDWVHFRIGPADLPILLAARPFERVDNPSYDYGSLHPPDWWKPESLRPGNKVYRWSYFDRMTKDTGTVFLNISSQDDEVYAVYYDN